MSFYHVLFARKHGFNSRLTWYENLFALIGGIASFIAKVLKIKGNTIVWNQIVHILDSTWIGQSATATYSDGVGTFNMSGQWDHVDKTNVYSIPLNHKALFTFDVKRDSNTGIIRIAYFKDTLNNTNVSLEAISSPSNDTWQTVSAIGIVGIEGCNKVAIQDGRTTRTEFQAKNIQLFDLTKMLGSTLADSIYNMEQSQSGSGVAYFRKLFPLDYYSYESGKLLNFNGASIKTLGFNQWDEEWKIGGYSTSNGTKQVDNSRIRSTNFIRCLPNTSYVIKSPATIILLYYDASQNYLNYVGITNTNPFTTPENACYMAFYVATSYGTTYKNDICINISDPSKNGTYEPYKESSLSLPISTYFPTGMKSAGNAYDELTPNKAIKRVETRAYQSGDESDPSVTTDGTNTNYALAIPIETAITENLNYKVYSGGTETLLPIDDISTSPFSANIDYPSGNEDVYFTVRESGVFE